MEDKTSAGSTRKRPPFVGSVEGLEREHGVGEGRYVVSLLGRELGLEHFGVNHETIHPGGRSSMPHAHSHDEEFVFVVEGRPSVWIDGYITELQQGDAVAFPAGTGIAHTFINNSDAPMKLLIVGEHSTDDAVTYPVNPERSHSRPWLDPPERELGPHDGRPDPGPAGNPSS